MLKGFENQSTLTLDDGTGLRVVYAAFTKEDKFDWDLFQGYDKLRVLTYSASADAIVRMLDQYSFDSFECVFGCEGTLRELKTILAFQQVVIGDTRAAIMGLKDERHLRILEKVHAGQAHFRVLRKSIAHAKLYLLSGPGDHNRVIIGSANLSERAFSGKQPETLVVFDDDEVAWDHYNRMFNAIRDEASDEISLPQEKITNAQIEVTDTPVMSDISGTLVIEALAPDDSPVTAPVQIERIEKVAVVLGPRISPAVPPMRNGRQTITPEIKREISRIRLVKSSEEADNRFLHIDRENRSAILSGERFSMEWDDGQVEKDASLLLDYFKNFEAFEGNVTRLQRDYFTLMSWLYFSPFICDMRSLALLQDNDVIRYPSFAIVFGKSNCGKTSLIDTLMTSMFGFAPTVDKGSFTRSQLRGLQHGYKRLPVVFDDIGRRAFNSHGVDMIKNESHPEVSEYPGFILSMNAAEPQSFPDEVVKRSLMIYTTTALPSYDEELRQRLQSRIQEMRRSLTGHFYRRYLEKVMDGLEADRLPGDWLALSSGVLSSILSESTGSVPDWCRVVTWLDYAEKRYDRVKARLENLLRSSAQAKSEAVANGNQWVLDGDRVIVLETRDAFGRSGFSWEDVPSTLIDQDASSPGRTVLNRVKLEEFTGQRLRPAGSWWKISFLR